MTRRHLVILCPWGTFFPLMVLLNSVSVASTWLLRSYVGLSLRWLVRYGLGSGLLWEHMALFDGALRSIMPRALHRLL